ncbi:Protein DGS1 [Hirschfeldia incana]|nr:Protein DGS1 [Hirschfeldia incana]
MDSQPPANGSTPSSTIGDLVPFYSSYLWNRVASLIPTSGKFTNLYRQTFTKKRHISLPLPLPSDFQCSSANISADTSRIYLVLEEIMADVLSNLHDIQKSLEFWQSRAQGSNARKAYFMVFERGPVAFVDESRKLVRKGFSEEDSAMQHLCQSSSSHMSDRMRVLMELRSSLASFLAQLYVELDKRGEDLLKNPEKSLPSLLVVIDRLFSNLEGSFSHLHAARESDSSIDGSNSMPLVFDRLPGVNEEGSQWTDCELTDAINLVHKNLEKLNSYLSVMVGKHRKPRRMTLYWVRYTCGAVGLSVLSLWLLRHSSLMGSSDIDNWIHDAKEATVSFFSDHVEQPLLAIRDELFDTFRKRHKGVMEAEEVQLTQDSLHRMLRNFCEQSKGEKVSDNATDQEMLEVVMHRYEKELVHPIHNLFSGELARGMLIQVQKLKLDIETAMLELEQILRANEINFAILAALPAFFLSLGLLALLRTWLKQQSSRTRKNCTYLQEATCR